MGEKPLTNGVGVAQGFLGSEGFRHYDKQGGLGIKGFDDLSYMVSFYIGNEFYVR